MYLTILYDDNMIYEIISDETKNESQKSVNELAKTTLFQEKHECKIKTFINNDSLITFIVDNLKKIKFEKLSEKMQVFLITGVFEIEKTIVFINKYDPAGDIFELKNKEEIPFLIHWLKERKNESILIHIDGIWNRFLQNHFDKIKFLF